MEDLETVIEDSLNDAQLSDIDTSTTEVAVADDTTVDVSPVTGEEAVDPDKTVVDPIIKTQPVEEPVKVTDEAEAFAKKWGVPARSVTGRENRLPHSRVREMVAKNEKEVTERVTKEVEAKWTPKVQEYETKIKNYDDQLKKVSEFEHYLHNQPRDFLEMLSQVPAYKPFFDHINKLAEQVQTGGQATAPAGAAKPDQFPHDPADPRPMPNKKQADGSMVYDMDGLDALLAWQARQVAKNVTQTVEQRITARYAPIEQERQLAQRKREQLAKLEPIIAKQLSDAEQWPHFKEHKGEILAALEADQNISLEGAYRQVLNQVVLPKLSTDRNALRAEILAELRRKPASTAAPVGRNAPVAPAAGPRTLEQIIEAEIAKIGG